MDTTSAGALAGIGNTPLVELVRVVPEGSERVMVKLELANPTGSMKDRMARTAIEGAIRNGYLLPGDTVVEYTAGTTGISLAFVCAALGYPLHIVFSDSFSVAKRRTMRAFGATVEDVPSDSGRINEKLIKSMIARAGEVAAEPGRRGATNSTTMTRSPAMCHSVRRSGTRPPGESMRSFMRLAPLTPSTVRPARYAPMAPHCMSPQSNRQSPPCSPAV